MDNSDNKIDVDIEFTDATLSHYDCDFEKVNEVLSRGGLFDMVGTWAVTSEVYLYTDLGLLQGRVSFYSDRTVGIFDCSCDNMDPQMNSEVPLFSQFVQQQGWNKPTVADSLARMDKYFWKYFYTTGIVNGNYLEKNTIRHI